MILYDGACGFCRRWVHRLLERDRRGVLRFAALQSAAATAALSRAGGAPTPLPDSVVLIDPAGVHVRSAAVLRILRHLGAPWSWLAVPLALVPRPLRDRVYDLVARHRARAGGSCPTPTPAQRQRFLDAE